MRTERSNKMKNENLEMLRKNWNETKKALTDGKISELKAIISNFGLSVSPMSFYFVKLQMEKLGFEGTPYLDVKTFNGWEENGFKVNKGEHSKIKGITWIGKENEEGKIEHLFPKEYHLFHKSQVREK